MRVVSADAIWVWNFAASAPESGQLRRTVSFSRRRVVSGELPRRGQLQRQVSRGDAERAENGRCHCLGNCNHAETPGTVNCSPGRAARSSLERLSIQTLNQIVGVGSDGSSAPSGMRRLSVSPRLRVKHAGTRAAYAGAVARDFQLRRYAPGPTPSTRANAFMNAAAFR